MMVSLRGEAWSYAESVERARGSGTLLASASGMRMKTTITMALVSAATLAGGCHEPTYTAMQPVASERPVTIAVPPPAPIEEQPPPSPYPGAVWMSGYWDWRVSLGRHVWIGGRWTTPPRPGLVWMPPRWVDDGAGRYYRSGGQWVPGAATDAYGRHVWYDAAGRVHYF
jgi:hypothetical protein